jgi:hypothetical protein
MQRDCAPYAVRVLALVITLVLPAIAASDERSTKSWEVIRSDFSNVRGLNYIASYAPSDVAMWRFYDSEKINRELGYIKLLGANSIRVWLAWFVFAEVGERFVDKFRNFLSLCEKHRITMMPILWDSCFGDARASYEDVTDWVANPGAERVADPAFREQGDRYVRAVVAVGRQSPSLLIWDVMNEPSVRKAELPSHIPTSRNRGKQHPRFVPCVPVHLFCLSCFWCSPHRQAKPRSPRPT